MIPTNEVLYIPKTQLKVVERILVESKVAGGKTVLILPNGSGVHSLYQVPQFSRHTWYIPYYIRPYDTAALKANLKTLKVFINTEVEGNDPLAPFRDPRMFPLEISAEILRRLKTPIMLDQGYAIYRLE